jgi:DnaK suppressor protein
MCRKAGADRAVYAQRKGLTFDHAASGLQSEGAKGGRNKHLETLMPSTLPHPQHAQPALAEADLARLKALLLQQERDMRSRDSELRARLAAEGADTTANTFVAGSEGAIAAEADDEVIALLRHEQTELAAAKEALQRINQGDYGWCAECGDNIGLRRLEAVPTAHLCVSCQDMVEHRLGRRPA